MTPKEKADRLIIDFKNILPRMDYLVLEETAKDCALICVHEILKANPTNTGLPILQTSIDDWKYWSQVKEEINKL